MQEIEYRLANGDRLRIREASGGDAPAVLRFVEAVGAETDFLNFGPGEFDMPAAEEEAFLEEARKADNQLYLLGLIDTTIVSSLYFSAGRRPRVRHRGEFGMSVRKDYWGQGIGSRMLEALVEWARNGGVIRKINLRVRTDNRRAIELYNRHGFVVEGTIRKEALIDGTFFDQHWMGLDLEQ